jgi:hypothetical protein
MKSKDTFADPRELKIIKEEFRQRDNIIAQLQRQNQERISGLQQKDDECRQLADLVGDMERRMKKAQTNSKSNMKHKTESKTKEKELNRVRSELREARGQAQQL